VVYYSRKKHRQKHYAISEPKRRGREMKIVLSEQMAEYLVNVLQCECESTYSAYEQVAGAYEPTDGQKEDMKRYAKEIAICEILIERLGGGHG